MSQVYRQVDALLDDKVVHAKSGVSISWDRVSRARLLADTSPLVVSADISAMKRSTRTLWRAIFRIGPHHIKSTWFQKPSWARNIVKTMKLHTDQDVALIGLEKKRVPLNAI